MLVRFRGRLTTKIHAVVDRLGLPLRLALTGGHQHSSFIATDLLHGLRRRDMALADKADDSAVILNHAVKLGGWVNIAPGNNRKAPICVSPYLYRNRIQVERFLNRFKQRRRIAT